jgi:hypothetical protein
MSITAREMQRLERDAFEISTRGCLPYLADAQRCLLDTRDPIAALALLSALWTSAHAGRGKQKAGLEEAGRWLEARIRREIIIAPERLALELGWLHRLVTIHGTFDDDRDDGERVGPPRSDKRSPPFGTHIALLCDKRETALARAKAEKAKIAEVASDCAASASRVRPEHLPDIFAARFTSWQDAQKAFKNARKRRKEDKQPKDRLLDVIPVAAELRHLAADLACSLLHTQGIDGLIDHTGDLPDFWIVASDLAPREEKRIPARIAFAPPGQSSPTMHCNLQEAIHDQCSERI